MSKVILNGTSFPPPKKVANNSSFFYVTINTYRPSAIGDLLLAVDLQKPIGSAAYLQVIDAAVAHAGVEQIHAGVALWSSKKNINKNK